MRSSASQEITYLLWNLKVHYRVHRYLLLVFIFSDMHPVHNFTPHFPKSHSNILWISVN